jgi:peptidoglycan/LPS O-acetylase OafA/YrhL
MRTATDFTIPFQWQWPCERLAMLLSFTWLIGSAFVGFTGRTQAVLEFPAMLYLGRISYGLYVLHDFAAIPVRLIADGLGVSGLKSGLPGFVLMSIVTVVGASLSWYCLEAPLNRLKKRYPYRKMR